MRRNVRQLLVLTFVVACGVSVVGCVSPGDPTPEKGAPTAVPPEPPRSALTIAADARYTIVAAAANKCVQLLGQSSADGARAQIMRCDGSAMQQFRLPAIVGGYHSIVNVASSKCLDVPGVSQENGTALQQYTCNNGLNQQWIIADAPGGYVRLVARHSGKVIDVQGASTNDGANLIQWPWSGDMNQRFKLNAVVATPVADAGDAHAGAGGAGGKGKAAAKTAKGGATAKGKESK